jgi:hypothetical protein
VGAKTAAAAIDKGHQLGIREDQGQDEDGGPHLTT